MPRDHKKSRSPCNKEHNKRHCKDTSSCTTSCSSCDGKEHASVSESCPPKACYKPCKGLCGPEIYTKYNAAVVNITSEFSFTTSTNPADLPTTQLISGTNLFTTYTHGNGFFIRKHIIICPSHLVLAPGDHTLMYNRWPFTANKINPANLQSDVMTRANRIFVDVLDVNGTGKAYTYQAELLALSGIGDVAVLFINTTWPWNRCIPCIRKCHPHFRFGCSRKYRAGMEVYAIGDAFARNFSAIGGINCPTGLYAFKHSRVFLTGTVADTRYVDYIGAAQPELLAVNLPIFGDQSGLPLIDRYGHVIGMQTMNICGTVLPNDTVSGAGLTGGTFYNQANGDGLVAGPSQFFMTHIIKVLICGLRKNNSEFTETIMDPVGDYIRYVQAFLGLAWEVFNGYFYMATRSATLGWPNMPRFNTAVPGEYIELPEQKEVIGLRVAGLTKDVPANRFRADIYLPGALAPGSNVASPWVTSPLNLALNDVITHAEHCALGDFGKQIPISLVTFRKKPGDIISITHRTIATNYQQLVEHSVVTVATPRTFDYPLYKYPSFPYAFLPAGFATFFRHPSIQDPSVAGLNPIDPTFMVPTIPVI